MATKAEELYSKVRRDANNAYQLATIARQSVRDAYEHDTGVPIGNLPEAEAVARETIRRYYAGDYEYGGHLMAPKPEPEPEPEPDGDA